MCISTSTSWKCIVFLLKCTRPHMCIKASRYVHHHIQICVWPHLTLFLVEVQNMADAIFNATVWHHVVLQQKVEELGFYVCQNGIRSTTKTSQEGLVKKGVSCQYLQLDSTFLRLKRYFEKISSDDALIQSTHHFSNSVQSSSTIPISLFLFWSMPMVPVAVAQSVLWHFCIFFGGGVAGRRPVPYIYLYIYIYI